MPTQFIGYYYKHMARPSSAAPLKKMIDLQDKYASWILLS